MKNIIKQSVINAWWALFEDACEQANSGNKEAVLMLLRVCHAILVEWRKLPYDPTHPQREA